MKNFIKVFFAGLFILSANTSVFASSPEPLPTDPLGPTVPHIKAVKVDFRDEDTTSANGFIAVKNLREAVRQLIGHAIGRGNVNSFVVLEPSEASSSLCAESPLNHPAVSPPPSGPPIPEGPTPAPISPTPDPVSPPSPASSLDSISPLDDVSPDPNLPAAPITRFDDLVVKLRMLQPGESVFLDVRYVKDCGIFN